jgi:FKBP-type peptidyl-prolyl cis-trans isomerase
MFQLLSGLILGLLLSYPWLFSGCVCAQIPKFELSDTLQAETLDAGLKRTILERGFGKQQAMLGSKIEADYVLYLPDGKLVENSFRDGLPVKFRIGKRQVIPGWEQGVMGLMEGALVALWVPADLAYGSIGRPGKIPGNSPLLFYIRILRVH